VSSRRHVEHKSVRTLSCIIGTRTDQAKGEAGALRWRYRNSQTSKRGKVKQNEYTKKINGGHCPSKGKRRYFGRQLLTPAHARSSWPEIHSASSPLLRCTSRPLHTLLLSFYALTCGEWIPLGRSSLGTCHRRAVE